jgi:ABC-type phosphate transport system substrate-binding protein
MPMLIDAYAAAHIDLQAKGSGTAIKALLGKAASIGMASRRALPQEVDEVASAAHLNLIGAGNEHVLALDGVAVIVNRDNRSGSLRCRRSHGFFPENFATGRK